MAELLGATEAQFDTDFAIINAIQQNSLGGASGNFAGTTTGGVSAMCGTKYANISARAERWSERPEFDNSWEDVDELPFVAAQGGGILRLYGFDSPSEDGLDLEGFGTGRVIVMARGRHRYGYSDYDTESLPPEEWLFRFFPEPGPPQPLSGPPRRLAGVAPFGAPPQTGWASALHAWQQTGWHSYLGSSLSYYAVHLGLLVAKRALTPTALAELSFPYIYRKPGERPVMPTDPLTGLIDPPVRKEDRLATSSGRPTTTLGETIEALRELQLLLISVRGGEEVLIPNPDPGFVWERIELSDLEIQGARRQIGYADFRQIAEDISIALDWVPQTGLQSTVRQMALRWSTTPAEIRGALALLKITDNLDVRWSYSEQEHADDDAPLFMRNHRG
jgi:hypothetical protein